MYKLVNGVVLAMSMVGFAMNASAAIDLGTAGKFNAFVFNDFTSNASDTEGAVVVGGNMNVTSYSVNANNKAYNGYALVVANNLGFTNGSIKHGNAYVGGTATTTGLDVNAIVNGSAPVSFANEKAGLLALSSGLSTLSANGSAIYEYGGVTFKGDGSSGVQVFNVSGSDLYNVNSSSFAQLSANQTIIINVSGAFGGFQGGSPNGFSNYNVLFNFYDATTLSFNNVGVYGSILAPFATVTGGGGQINGNVIVNAWNSNIQINANHYFKGADIDIPQVSTVPELESYAMLTAGLCLAGYVARRRKAYSLQARH